MHCGKRGSRRLGNVSFLHFFTLSRERALAEFLNLFSREKDDTDESSSLLGPGRNAGAGRGNEQQMKMIKAVLYAVQVFYSFFIM